MEEIQTKHLDMQLAVNLRALILGTREGLPLLREAGAEHGKALIVNTASIAGKGGPGLALDLRRDQGRGDQLHRSRPTARPAATASSARRWRRASSTPPMTEFAKGQVPAEAMIQPADLGEAVRFLLRTSRNCHVPEIVFTRPGEGLDTP